MATYTFPIPEDEKRFYCTYCGKRCYVIRKNPLDGLSLLMATCPKGRNADTAFYGFDADGAEPYWKGLLR